MTASDLQANLLAVQAAGSPSFQLVCLAAEALAEVSAFALNAAWERWIGPQRFARKLAQFERAGLLESLPGGTGLERVMRMTSRGRMAALGGRDPEACWRRAWDGRWRLVLFDVPESHRNLRIDLRRKLRALGFGYLQNSVWITPDSVDALAQTLGEADDVETLSFMEAVPCAGETDAQLVLGAWDFERINRGYQRHAEILRARPTPACGHAGFQRWLEAEWASWCVAVRADPLLPAALLPTGYNGQEALQRRQSELRKLLALR